MIESISECAQLLLEPIHLLLSQVGRRLSRVSDLLSLVGDPVALIRDLLALIRDAIPIGRRQFSLLEPFRTRLLNFLIEAALIGDALRIRQHARLDVFKRLLVAYRAQFTFT